MFKKKLAKGIEFFPSDGPDASCDRPPRDVMKGIPILEGCREVKEEEEVEEKTNYIPYPTNIANVNLVMGCCKVLFTILTPALAY